MIKLTRLKMNKLRLFILFILLTAGSFNTQAKEDSRLLRLPDINGNLVAFVYAGDIWTVEADGGTARQLTTHEGLELFPKISPDGKWIAYSGEYGGNRQVYVIPSEGGTPKQLTYYNSVGMMPPRGGFDHVVLDWTPDSKNILFRSNRTEFGERNGKYFTVSLDGGFEKPLPIVNGGFAVFSPDANQLCFTPVDREFRSWKRYKGGRATELWIYNLENNSSEQITHFAGSDQWPVWEGNNIFFASDRDLKLNIYRYNTETKETEKITNFPTFDVMWLSGQNGQLVFENGGYLYKTDMNSGETEKITVNIRYDNPNRLPSYKSVIKNIHSYAISPTGKRVLIDARGDIFSVPVENGKTENLTQTPGIREIYPNWSPNGKYISWYSDATGEYEIYLLENKKNAEPVQITSGSSAWKHDSEWSPDSKYLLYSDRSLKLKLWNVEEKKEEIITSASQSEIRDYSFSPDSKWVLYSKESSNGQSAIWVYDIYNKANFQLTDDTFNDYSPVFSVDSQFIFFLSNRDFNLSFSSFEFDYLYDNATRIYALTLKKDGPRLYKNKIDVEPVKVEAPEEKTEEKSKKNLPKAEPLVEIDVEGTDSRIIALPTKPGSYYNLQAVEGGLLYISGGKLNMYNIEKEESSEIMANVQQAIVAADNKTMLYRSGNDFGVTAIKAGIKAGEGKLDLGGLKMKIDPVKEWEQIFTDGWRIFRDYFYVENLHEVDWEAIRNNYSQLLPSVGHRADLDYILGEMVSETNTGHAYVNWGDFKTVERVENGLPGARLEEDISAGRYKFSKIYKGENWNEARRSPLTEQGVDVKEGDYLIRINNHEIFTGDNPYLYFENSAEGMLEITVSENADGSNARTSIIKPIKSELELMYLNWVNERRQMVEEWSGGRIGYIHVPNTSYEGNRELFRGMYAFHDKEALIIDDRYNGGGFIPDVMTGLLDRKTLSYWNRGNLDPMKTPGIAHDGPKVMLINGYSSSGGDALPYYFRKKGLGQLIGTRTWGGLVGISGNASLVDGGSISVPQFGVFDENGEWIIEGIGVYPDIEVFDRPEELAKGNDPTLKKAVEVLLEELNKNLPQKIKTPAPPNRSGFIEKNID